MHKQDKKGFTLIELLVVIAIVSLLASVILASLSSARDKAKDSALKQSVREYEKLLVSEYEESGDYQALSGYFENDADCESISGSSHDSEAQAICKDILSNAVNEDDEPFRVHSAGPLYQSYAIGVGLNLPTPSATFFCIKSSGTVTILSTIVSCI